MEFAQTVTVAGPTTQQCRTERREREVFAHPVPGIGVTGQDQGAVDGVRPKESVDDLQGAEHAAGAVGNVEGERAVRAGMRIFHIGANVFLDERRKRGFPQIPVAVDSGVEQEVNVVGVSPSPLQTSLGRRDRQMQRTVAALPVDRAPLDNRHRKTHNNPPTTSREHDQSPRASAIEVPGISRAAESTPVRRR